MGNTDPDYAAGHAACARGEWLYLGLDGWDEKRSRFADGFLACMAEQAEAVSKSKQN